MSLIDILDPRPLRPTTPGRVVRPTEEAHKTLKKRLPPGAGPRYEQLRAYRQAHKAEIKASKSAWENANRAHKNAYNRVRWRKTAPPGRSLRHLGETNAAAKLTAAKVREMRLRYAQGGITIEQLAPLFEISPSAAANAISGRTWAHVT